MKNRWYDMRRSLWFWAQFNLTKDIAEQKPYN
jgi:hypothetical protein